jgi:hypothetical protein
MIAMMYSTAPFFADNPILNDSTVELAGALRRNASCRESGGRDVPVIVFSPSSRVRYCPKAAARAATFRSRGIRQPLTASALKRPRGNVQVWRLAASSPFDTAAFSVPRCPARRHPCVQERTTRHEKRNADQCLATGGMPDRDH